MNHGSGQNRSAAHNKRLGDLPNGRRFAQLLNRIIEDTGSERYAMRWLESRHDQLGGQSPLDVIRSGHIEAVEQLINMYETGQPL